MYLLLSSPHLFIFYSYHNSAISFNLSSTSHLIETHAIIAGSEHPFHPSMSGLIVDFPQVSSRGRIVRKKVRFSSRSKMMYFECHDEDNSRNIWYSDDEYKDMKIANARAVHSVREKLNSMRSLHNSASNECVVTGIEKLLTTKLIMKSKASRRRHLNAVLGEQDRQHLEGECDAIKIALVSLNGSKWSTKTAQKIGVLQSMQK